MQNPTNTVVEGYQQSLDRAERVYATLPLGYGAAGATTQNISATGVLFSTNEDAELGSTVTFTVEVVLDGRRLNLVCEGKVVRVEHQNGRTSVAARLSDSFFEVA
ncbi:PilZ domain-containing protein [Rhodoferax sp. GW822-FHT02A01]|uniref:PilZ domain-containing protein n=1 Tax=Rhodoferax sp. GW822-FHT02A01 TaxID=3141537 RepID=UPI00315DB00D